ncbi:MAG: serine acetyltransferase [bacterium]|nr:serine acetyltransferase [bacterium]
MATNGKPKCDLHTEHKDRFDSKIILKDSLEKVVNELCEPDSYGQVMYRDIHDVAMPSVRELGQIVDELRTVLFPGYFCDTDINRENISFYTGATVARVTGLLTKQLNSGFCVACFHDDNNFCSSCDTRARKSAIDFISTLPKIRRLLATDVKAAYIGDPASKDMNEVIYCYPSIKALTSFRIAHELHALSVPLIPRIITEMAHSETGIDIHPAAQIGETFFIDHGTGTVIGATSIIGKNVRIYQGVTLGAKSFPLDKDGNPMKGIPRHPIVEDDVIIYSGATILGRITIGKGAVIGGNVWVTNRVAPGARVMQPLPKQSFFEGGGGI